MVRKSLLMVSLMVFCGMCVAQSVLERELLQYSQEFMIFGDGHVRELLEYGRQGRQDSLLNSLNGEMSLLYYNAEEQRVIIKPTRNTSIDFSVSVYGADTLVCALVTTQQPYPTSMIYVDRTMCEHGEELPTRRAATKQNLPACPPTFCTARLSEDRQHIIVDNQTWRMLDNEEQQYVVPQLVSDTLSIYTIFVSESLKKNQ